MEWVMNYQVQLAINLLKQITLESFLVTWRLCNVSSLSVHEPDDRLKVHLFNSLSNYTYLHWEKGFHVWKNTPCLHSKLRWLQAQQKELVSFNRQLLTETCWVSYPLPDIYFAAHAARAADAHDLCFTRSCLFRRAIAQAGENLTRRVW